MHIEVDLRDRLALVADREHHTTWAEADRWDQVDHHDQDPDHR